MKKLTIFLMLFIATLALNAQVANKKSQKVKNTISAAVTFKVTVPAGTNQCWIVGSFNGWNNNLNQMTKVDSTHFTITMDAALWNVGVTINNLEYKYLSGGGDWAYVEKDAQGNELLSNRKYTDSNGIDVVAKWAATYNPNILPLPLRLNITVTTPAGTKECYIVGNFNNWVGPMAPVDSIKMNKLMTHPNGQVVFTKQIVTPDANKLLYHFCSGPDWSYEQLSPVGDYKYPEINPVVTAWRAVYDPAKTGTIKIKATVPAGTKNVWIQGSYLGWDMAKAVPGIKNPDGTFSFSVPNVLSIEYKLYNKPDWNYCETDSTGIERQNRTASYPTDSIKNIKVFGWKQKVDSIIDNIAPTAPSGLKNTVPTTNSFYLSWNAATDNVGVVGYEVYKDSVYCGITSMLGLNINNLVAGKTYKMTVKAVDAAGNKSLASQPLFVTTLPNIVNNITFNVTVPKGTYQCWIVGNFNGWNNNLNQMARVDSTHFRFTLDLASLPMGLSKDSIRYKFCSGGGNWAYVEKNATGGDIIDRYYTPADVVSSWALIYNPTVVPLEGDALIMLNAPVAVKVCYIVGTFNNWAIPTDSTLMFRKIENNDSVLFTIRVHTKDLNTLQYKFCAGPGWEYAQTSEPNFIYPPDKSVVTVSVKAFNKIYDPTKTGNIKIKATVPLGTRNVWLNGSHIGWDMTKAVAGKKNLDGTFSFLVPNVLSVQYKLYNKPDKGYFEVDTTGVERQNRVANYPADSVINIKVFGWKFKVDSIVDNIAPTVPTGLMSSAITSNSFNLTWNPSSDNMAVVGYKVFKDSVLFGSTPSTSINIIGLLSGKTYKMTVKAFDALGIISAASMPLLVTTTNVGTNRLTFNVTVPVGTNQCWVVGNFNNWNNNINRMNKVDQFHYSITLNIDSLPVKVSKDSVEYKYLSGGGDWAYVEKDSLGLEVPNRKYSITNGMDVVAKWATIYNPEIPAEPKDVTINVLTPAGTKECYIVGTFNAFAGPTAPNCKMTKITENPDGKVVFGITIHSDDVNKLAYRFCSGPEWTYEQNMPLGDYRYPEVAPIVYSWKAIYDPAKTGTIKIKANVPTGTKRVWIVGSYLGWDMTKAVEGIKNTDNTFSFVVPNALVIEYRLYNKPDWLYPEVDLTGVERPNRIASYPTDSMTNITVQRWKMNADSIAANGINVIVNGGGYVNENNVKLTSGGFLTVNAGGTKTFTFTPNGPQFELASVLYNDVEVKSQIVGGSFITPPVNGNFTLVVTYKIRQYKISLKSAESGVVNLICEYWFKPTFEFVAAEGWKVNTIMYNNQDVTNAYMNKTFIIPPVYNDVIINVSFQTTTMLAMPSSGRVKVFTNMSDIIIDGTTPNEMIRLYTADGAQLHVLRSEGERLVIPVQPGTIYLIKTQSKTFKVIM